MLTSNKTQNEFLIKESLENYSALPIGKALGVLTTIDEKSFNEGIFAKAGSCKLKPFERNTKICKRVALFSNIPLKC